jgi:hypothetical protein
MKDRQIHVRASEGTITRLAKLSEQENKTQAKVLEDLIFIGTKIMDYKQGKLTLSAFLIGLEYITDGTFHRDYINELINAYASDTKHFEKGRGMKVDILFNDGTLVEAELLPNNTKNNEWIDTHSAGVFYQLSDGKRYFTMYHCIKSIIFKVY